MMLASVTTEIDTEGRRGIAFIGGLPLVGRLFTSPTRDKRAVDIVIAVTPRVLRAPTVTPRDEEMRPSGTLQSPTTGLLADMLREADRDEQIAAGRQLPRNASIQLPDAPLQIAPQTTAAQTTVAQTSTTQSSPAQTNITQNATQTATQNNARQTTAQLTVPSAPTTTALAEGTNNAS
jgi:general secretion pathway protein D